MLVHERASACVRACARMHEHVHMIVTTVISILEVHGSVARKQTCKTCEQIYACIHAYIRTDIDAYIGTHNQHKYVCICIYIYIYVHTRIGDKNTFCASI